MDRQIHGILSLFLIAAAILTAAFTILPYSPVWAGVYLAVTVLSFPVMVVSFCAKCPCRNAGCGHVVFGMRTRYLPPRGTNSYSVGDIAGVTGPLAFIVAFPLYWLIRQPVFFIPYIVLLVAAAVEIRLAVCKGCANGYCPVCPKKS